MKLEIIKLNYSIVIFFLLVFFVNIISVNNVLADSREEFQGCMRNCMGDSDNLDNDAYDVLYNNCLVTCKASFPVGYQIMEDILNESSVDMEIIGSEGGGGNSQINFTPNVPIGDFRGSIPVDKNILGKYFNAWYRFVVGVVGVLATVIIMWGGFKWLTSRGNSAAISDAKDRIWSAVIGLILVFLSYNILNLINPKLLTIGLPDLKTVAGSHGFVNQSSVPSQAATPQPGATPQPTSESCQDLNNATVLDYSNVQPRNPGVDFTDSQDAWFDQYGEAYGVDPDMLRAICAAESSGNPRVVSPAGAYGLMQIMPATATAVVGRDSNLSSVPEFSDGQISGNELINNPELSVAISASFVNANQDGLGRADIFAGYNGGYGTGSGSALSQSRDCPTPGVRAYQCCINPGGLAETQGYVNNTMSYYNYYSQE